MTTAVQHRRGTTAEHAAFTGLEGEVTIDTTKDTAVIHDGTLAGGYPLAKENLANVTTSGLSSIDGASTASDDKFFIYDQSATSLKTITRAELNNAIEQDTLANVAITGGTINGTTIGATTAAALSATTLSASGDVTLSGATANGVVYANGSKVLTTGSALTFDGTKLDVAQSGASSGGSVFRAYNSTDGVGAGQLQIAKFGSSASYGPYAANTVGINAAGTSLLFGTETNNPVIFYQNNTEQMRLTSTGLGIGTSSPTSGGGWTPLLVLNATSAALVVKGVGGQENSFGSSNGLFLDSLGSSTASNNAIIFRTTNFNSSFVASERLRITSAGNVGIGTSSPAYELDVASTGQADIRINSAASNDANLRFATGGTNKWVQFYEASSGALKFYDNTATATRLTLDSSGNLGLGVTPSAWASSFKAMQLGAGGYVSGRTNTDEVYVGANSYFDTTDNRWEYIANDVATQYYQDAGAHVWRTAPSGTAGNAISFTQAMSLTSAGTLLVGRTSPSDTTVGFEVTSGGRVNCGMASGDAYILFSTSAGAYRFYVTNAGVINATSTTITAISDQRLKENIRDLDDGLDVVMALKPRKFDWKAGKGQDIKNARGFIAQEFEQVLPDMIEEWKDPAPEGEEPYKAINANLIPTLVKAIQELKAEFDAYKAAHP